jgi:ABC-type transport system substrate-binding protein
VGVKASICLPADPISFNPQLSSDEATLFTTRMIYDRLVEQRPAPNGRASTQVDPGLAESWNVSKDGLVYTFQLRRGVPFHRTAYFTPTRHLGAEDVIFSFNRQRLSTHPFHRVGGGSYPEFTSLGLQKNLVEVEKIGEHAVRFRLVQADPAFLSKLASTAASILSAEYGESLLAKGTAWDLDRLPVGTGPYLLRGFDRGKAVQLATHAGYFRGKAPTETLTFPVITSVALREEKIKSGQCLARAPLVFP